MDERRHKSEYIILQLFVKQEVQQELHNDSVMQELRETGQRLKQDTESIGQDL